MTSILITYSNQSLIQQYNRSLNSEIKALYLIYSTYPPMANPNPNHTSDETRIADAEYWLEKGNNNSAKGEEVLIHKMIGKEVSNSWGIVFPRKDCLSVEGAGIMPATVAEK